MVGSELTSLHMYRHAAVTLTCDVCEQSFGHLLFKGDRLSSITHELVPVLALSATGKTLQGIHSEFGQWALDSLGDLYVQGFVSLTW